MIKLSPELMLAWYKSLYSLFVTSLFLYLEINKEIYQVAYKSLPHSSGDVDSFTMSFKGSFRDEVVISSRAVNSVQND